MADLYRASGDIGRITSREIVPTGRISTHFLPSHKWSPPSLSVAFVRISGNGEGLALRDLTGTISREAAIFLLPVCLLAWLEGTQARLICWEGSGQWKYNDSAYCCALAR